MRDHDDIGLDPHDVLRPLDVGVNDPLAKKRVLDVWFIHRTEHSGLKAIGLGVVKLLEVSNRLLLLVLEV
jgi:hypothetical protein